MKKISAVILFIVLLLPIMYCQKKLFKHIQIKGRVIHFFTGKPIVTSVALRGDDRHDNSEEAEGTLSVCVGSTKADGSFDFKTNAWWKNHYKLFVNEDSLNDNLIQENISIPDGSTKDFGDLLIGRQKFFCRVNAVSISGSSIVFSGAEPYPILSSGQFSQFLYSEFYTNEMYLGRDRNLWVRYTLENGGVSTNSFTAIPIHNFDTLRTTIYF